MRHHERVPDRLPATVVTLAAPWGPLHAAATNRGIVALAMFTDREAFSADVTRLPGIVAVDAATSRETVAPSAHLEQLTEELARYFAGTLDAFDVPLDLRVRSEWDRLVLDGVCRIPR